MSNEVKSYIPVDFDTLKAGMLTDRPLYVYLVKNSKHIRIAHPLRPLTRELIKKIGNIGSVFSTIPSLEEREPELIKIAAMLSGLLSEATSKLQAPFESSRKILDWITPVLYRIFKTNENEGSDLNILNIEINQSEFLILMMNRVFKFPNVIPGSAVEEFSVKSFDLGLLRATTAGLLALILGYSDERFLCEYMQSVLAEDMFTAQSQKADRTATDNLDERFNILHHQLNHSDSKVYWEEDYSNVFHKTATAQDELWDLSLMARSLALKAMDMDGSVNHKSLEEYERITRISRKIKKTLDWMNSESRESVVNIMDVPGVSTSAIVETKKTRREAA